MILQHEAFVLGVSDERGRCSQVDRGSVAPAIPPSRPAPHRDGASSGRVLPYSAFSSFFQERESAHCSLIAYV